MNTTHTDQEQLDTGPWIFGLLGHHTLGPLFLASPQAYRPFAHPWNSSDISLFSSFLTLASLPMPTRKDLEFFLRYQVSHLYPLCVHVLGQGVGWGEVCACPDTKGPLWLFF